MNSKSSSCAFRMYGVTPIWGSTHRYLLKETSRQRTVSSTREPNFSNYGSLDFGASHGQSRSREPASCWLLEVDVEPLGLKLTDPNAPRVVSPWGKLVSRNSTSDDETSSVLSLEAFQARRIPLSFNGMRFFRAGDEPRLQKLMVDSPSEFSSMYWGSEKEVLAAGVSLLPDSHGVECGGITFFNAGQTTNPSFFTPETCVANVAYLIPEMKNSHCARSFYWDTVRRGNVNCSDDWFTDDFATSHHIALKPEARPVAGRYNGHDCEDPTELFNAKKELRNERNKK